MKTYCKDKNHYRTRAIAQGRADRDYRRFGKRLYPYPCPNCGQFHLTKIKSEAFIANASDAVVAALVKAQGEVIANDETRAARKKVQELTPIVQADREWLKRMADAAEFHQACADALRKIVDAHFASLAMTTSAGSK